MAFPKATNTEGRSFLHRAKVWVESHSPLYDGLTSVKYIIAEYIANQEGKTLHDNEYLGTKLNDEDAEERDLDDPKYKAGLNIVDDE